MNARKEELIAKLRQDIIAWEGYRPPEAGSNVSLGLGPVETAFPNSIFPTGTIHEVLSATPEDTAACGAFLCGLLSRLLADGGACLWISWSRRIYPPALKRFGLNADRIIFVDVPIQKDVLWIAEEALKCEGVAAVICETTALTFMESRRLLLAVETSRVTGFILRKGVKNANSTACTARWQIRPVRSSLRPGMPGVGHPRWQVDLLKVKNGQPGSWTLEWKNKSFKVVTPQPTIQIQRRYA
ncbi:Error-prone repair protein ImuA [Mucilaginibacter limnophilus]|uniref:Error-prone repair protein ImuA n=1 Tax=Mucilaginibacter limnophilus TaxID=1932778 RepID=A0A437MI81_9SPHI|nr:Error-prone repair protein ImuA [Mucilaginibacter limnophilus]RVT97325.1 Error-prone repair protein ImuA [Mucilaginibacter limnophilus]